jgi:uncharacterized protein YbcV (DUF1398 family)
MVIRSYFDKSNTIIYNNPLNTGLNPIAELFYGGPTGSTTYSRHLLHFDESRLVSFYTGGTIPDLSKVTHTLKMTNTGAFNTELLNGMYDVKQRTSSFDLIVFPINQLWDEGVGYDYDLSYGAPAISTAPSNWYQPTTNFVWFSGAGVYSGNPTVIGTQHFDHGNENINIDITNYINGILTGNTNYGLGVAYSGSYETLSTGVVQYVGFFSRHTQTYYEPYIETIYNNHILDNRNNFYLDKPNNLYLYVNLNGNPTNLDVKPSVNVFDNSGNLFSAFTPSQVNQITKGVYSISLSVPTTNNTIVGTLYNDIWTGITINSVTRPNISLDFELKDSFGYYNIGANDIGPKRAGISISGIRQQDKIKRGDIRKVVVSTRKPYTVDQSQDITNLQYRLYVKEGQIEVTVIDFEQVEIATNYNYFLLDTNSLIPNDYYLDILYASNQEITTLKNVINFTIVSDAIDRTFQ